MATLKDTIIKLLEKTLNNLKADNSELSESEAIEIMSILTHHVMSKATASRYLNMKEGKFDKLVRMKILPKGKKRVGFKEIVWYQDELDKAIKVAKEKNYIK